MLRFFVQLFAPAGTLALICIHAPSSGSQPKTADVAKLESQKIHARVHSALVMRNAQPNPCPGRQPDCTALSSRRAAPGCTISSLAACLAMFLRALRHPSQPCARCASPRRIPRARLWAVRKLLSRMAMEIWISVQLTSTT